MPLLFIESNQSLNDTNSSLLGDASAVVAAMLGKPESYVMVKFQHNPHMVFAGNTDPLAYLELKSIGLDESNTGDFSQKLTALVHDKLNISADRIYIEFANAQRNMWGWNSGTF